ncbi:MAG: ATP-binding protein, partial [Euryarchaeota archaeon]|nr:ATP-binding protein [Euryarchaeota archaeon]
DYLSYAIEEVLDNSIKFNREGGLVRLEVRRRNGTAEVVFCDTGEGIAEEQMELIFEPFYQGDMSTTRRHPGIGLGLTLAKKIVELHNGGVVVECRKNGEGVVCRISLPQSTSSCCSH